MSLRGVIFDLDGTLVDSRLDFDAIRRDIGLPPGRPILEALAAMPDGPELERCLAVLDGYEQRGARDAVLMPGAAQFLQQLSERDLLQAVLTRNSRASTELVLSRLELRFNPVLTRDDVPPKPDPTGLERICRTWNVTVGEVLFIGDYLFDLQAGRNAGIRTVLYAPDDPPVYADQADFMIGDFGEALSVIEQCSPGA